jgi:hypothetical protein
MVATWHPFDGFDPFVMHLFTGASYASAVCYPMDYLNVIDTGLRVIKCCGMYAKEYKNCISCKNLILQIVKMIDITKE